MPGKATQPRSRERVNWTGDERWRPARVERPVDRDELVAAVTRAAAEGSRVRVAGSHHSFNDIARAEETAVDVSRIDAVIEMDRDSGLVRVGSGISISKLSRALDAAGLALENLGDIDRQTISGAVSTATHGTGARLGNISTQVEAVELITAAGQVVELDRSDADDTPLLAARVGLGALGAISALTLRCVPAFNLHRVDEPRPLNVVLERFTELAEGNDHFEFFVFPYTRKALAIRRNRTERPARPRGRLRRFLGDVVLENGVGDLAMRAARRWPGAIPRINATTATVMSQGDQIDRAFRVFANRRTIRFTEMEYAIPRDRGPEAIEAVLRLIERERFGVPLPIECRVVAGDESLLSPAHRRDSTYVAVHQYRGMEWRPYFEAVEEIMRSFDGRPHWGKRHGRTAADLAPVYPRWEEFLRARDRLDPGRTFANAYTDRVLGP